MNDFSWMIKNKKINSVIIETLTKSKTILLIGLSKNFNNNSILLLI